MNHTLTKMIRNNLEPDDEKKNKRKAIFNDCFFWGENSYHQKQRPIFEIVKFFENEYIRDHDEWLHNDQIAAKDFVFVALIIFKDETIKEGEFTWIGPSEQKFYLFAKDLEELKFSINNLVMIHQSTKKFSQIWEGDKQEMSTVVERQCRKLIYEFAFESYIYPNSRCLDCRRPMNPLLETYQLEKNKTGTKTYVRCSRCVAKSERAEQERLKILANPKYGAYKTRWEVYKNGNKDIHWKIVGELENWICHLCEKVVDYSLPTTHPLAPTVDHIIPITKGGKHEWDNVKLAHRSCNASKGNRRMLMQCP